MNENYSDQIAETVESEIDKRAAAISVATALTMLLTKDLYRREEARGYVSATSEERKAEAREKSIEFARVFDDTLGSLGYTVVKIESA